jgi:hypothetical protein
MQEIPAMDKQRMLELAERCEAATGPDWGLDREIWLAAFATIDDRTAIEIGWEAHGEAEAEFRINRLMDGFAPTASIDAALTLVPEGMSVRMGWCAGAGYAECFTPGSYGDRDLGTGTIVAATPALALTAAALRAHAGDTGNE